MIGLNGSQETSWPGLSRPSTSLEPALCEDVDARDKRGHDDPRMAKRTVTVNDKMQKRYRYVRSAPVGRDFDPAFKPQLTPPEIRTRLSSPLIGVVPRSHGRAWPGHPRLSFHPQGKTWMPGTRPRLSGLFFVDRAHDVDSSVF